MHYLALFIISMLAFTQMVRYAQRRGAGVLAVSAANYVVAAVLSALILVVAWPQASGAQYGIAGGLGAAAGVLFFVNLLLLLAGYELVGVGITIAFMQMGVVLPVLASWGLWGEVMTPWNWGAVALLPVAVLLMRPVSGGEHRRVTLRGDLILLAAFVAPGLVGCLHKALHQYAPDAGPRAYQAALFFAAAVCSVAYARWRRIGYTRKIVSFGAVLGAVNVAATQFALIGIGILGAVVFFPISSSLVIASQVVLSWILWRERITRRQLAGLLVAICIVILASIGANDEKSTVDDSDVDRGAAGVRSDDVSGRAEAGAEAHR
jgi:drug/metabolite transporter (DMT)-like permease